MDKVTAINVLKRVVINLIEKNYAEVVKEDSVKLIPAADIQLAIEEYPGIATMPPDSAFNKMDYSIRDNPVPGTQAKKAVQNDSLFCSYKF